MTPIVSLRFLTEPAYVLVGALLPGEDPPAEVRLLFSTDAVLSYPPTARPILEYLSVLRSEADLVETMHGWGSTPDDLDGLVRDGRIIRFPADDEDGVRERLEGLAVRVTAGAVAIIDGESVRLHLPTDRRVGIGLESAAVLDTPRLRTLSEGVREVSKATETPEDFIWRSVIHDLTTLLSTGAGALVRVGAEP